MGIKGKKINKNTYPNGLIPNDFKCYGPVASKDTEFRDCCLADMGCFTQDGKDSNKYYHVAICTDPSGNWYVYNEYGRQGAGKPQFQFIACNSKEIAQLDFIEKCNEKNTKRGKFDTVASRRMFVPKPGKDLYTVRQLAKRTHGLPDAQNIAAKTATAVVKPRNNTSVSCDH